MISNTTILDLQPTEFSGRSATELRQAIESELEAICSDPQFRSSPRNCAFLRYVVTGTLEGRATEIKERIIGTELFGRPVSYDTGSDSVVRVRANEVRKRLTCYYEEHRSQSGWRIQMPLRSYVPRFVREALFDSPATDPTSREVMGRPAVPGVLLTLSQMMMPTLVALFLCVATFRWQIFSGTPYLEFWDSLLAGRSQIALVLDPDSADPRTVTVEDLKAINPLLQAAVMLGAVGQVQNSADPSPNGATVVAVHITHQSLPSGAPLQGDPQAAYVTVIPGKHPELWIASRSPTGIGLAIRLITDTDDFPQALGMALRRDTPTRIRISEGQEITAQNIASNAASGGKPWPH